MKIFVLKCIWTRVCMYVLWAICSSCLASTSQSLPIKILQGPLQWHSATHAQCLLTLQIQRGWKLYGPEREGDTLIHPVTLTLGDPSQEVSSEDTHSQNISHINVTWPEPTLWRNAQKEQAHVYYENMEVLVDIFLKNRQWGRACLVLEGMVCSHLCKPFVLHTQLDLQPPATSLWSWFQMLVFAFLGGALLNVMPCVLPVIGLKIQGFVQKSAEAFRSMCVYSALGIFSGFWLMAIIMVMLKHVLGYHLSWGMQWHSPYFAISMILVMIASAYGLWGMFHVYTPQWVVRASMRSQQMRTLWIKHFASGLLAVLLATPCSAPLLGPAIGFALTGSSMEIFYFYTAISLGFALPYIAGLFIPVYKYMPKPGSWMIVLEYAMGMLFMGSAIWLVGWPLSAFLSSMQQYIAWGLLAVAATLPILKHITWVHTRPSLSFWLFRMLPLVLALGFLGLPLQSEKQSKISMQDGKIHWLPFSSAMLKKTLQSGRVVVLDVTGMGCALCMVNKRIFLRPEVQQILLSPQVVCMRADYSHGNPEVARLLQEFNRFAIPCNLVLSKNYPKGIILSEVLSEEEIIKAVQFMQKLAKAPHEQKDERPTQNVQKKIDKNKKMLNRKK